MDNDVAAEVQLQFMRPAQAEAAMRRFPVVYVPFGLIEWHGRHLPLGTDALKAHAILVTCAQQSGGIVYPPIYFPFARNVHDHDSLHEEDRSNFKIPFLTSLFERLKLMGFRVIIGVSGHNVAQQITWINTALQPVLADGTVAGIGMWEVSLTRGLSEEYGTDHAAKWETSDMMFYHPELVSMTELGSRPLAPKMKGPDGISGLDPREHASPEVGRRNCQLAAAAIGAKARELLASLPEPHRKFRLPTLSPEHWWTV